MCVFSSFKSNSTKTIFWSISSSDRSTFIYCYLNILSLMIQHEVLLLKSAFDCLLYFMSPSQGSIWAYIYPTEVPNKHQDRGRNLTEVTLRVVWLLVWVFQKLSGLQSEGWSDLVHLNKHCFQPRSAGEQLHTCNILEQLGCSSSRRAHKNRKRRHRFSQTPDDRTFKRKLSSDESPFFLIFCIITGVTVTGVTDRRQLTD